MRTVTHHLTLLLTKICVVLVCSFYMNINAPIQYGRCMYHDVSTTTNCIDLYFETFVTQYKIKTKTCLTKLCIIIINFVPTHVHLANKRNIRVLLAYLILQLCQQQSMFYATSPATWGENVSFLKKIASLNSTFCTS